MVRVRESHGRNYSISSREKSKKYKIIESDLIDENEENQLDQREYTPCQGI
jgi:hypothetical protein